MRVMVIGGDGYCGWATSLHLLAKNHDVLIVDNEIRRHWDAQLGIAPLIPLRSLIGRVAAVREAACISEARFSVAHLDVTHYSALSECVKEWKPEAIVHFGEQRSAPFSMISRSRAVETQMNNVVGTLNILYAMKAHVPNAHLVKLGTMGEYGTPNIDIEEGYIDITHNGRSDRLPYPMQPGSFYHASKVHDTTNIRLACKLWNLRATDLNQGIVYGMYTAEIPYQPPFASVNRFDYDTTCLVNRFDYDHIFGTVLNRFIVQASIGEPLTVYGTGKQTRGFINIRDTVACINLACMNPPAPGDFRVMNQFTEQFSVLQLAGAVVEATSKLGYKPPTVSFLPNPRVEAAEHYYNAKHSALKDLGLIPTTLKLIDIGNMVESVKPHIGRVDRKLLLPTVDWR